MSNKDISYRDESYPAVVLTPCGKCLDCALGDSCTSPREVAPSPSVSLRRQPATVVNNGVEEPEMPGLEMVGSIAKMHRAGVFCDMKEFKGASSYGTHLQKLKPLSPSDLSTLAEPCPWIPPPISNPSGRLAMADEYIDTFVAFTAPTVFMPSLEPVYKNQNKLERLAGLPGLSSPRAIDRRHERSRRIRVTKALRRKENKMAREIAKEPKAGSLVYTPPVSTLGSVSQPTFSQNFDLSGKPDVSIVSAPVTPTLTDMEKLEKALSIYLKMRVDMKKREKAWLAGAEDPIMPFDFDAHGKKIAEVRSAINTAKQQAAVKKAKNIVFEKAPKEFVPHTTSGPSRYSASDCFKARYSRKTVSPSVSKSSRFTTSNHRSLLDATSPASIYLAKQSEIRRTTNHTTHEFLTSRLTAKYYTDSARSKKMTNGRPVFDYESRSDLRNDIVALEAKLTRPAWYWNQPRTFNFDLYPRYNRSFRDNIALGPLDMGTAFGFFFKVFRVEHGRTTVSLCCRKSTLSPAAKPFIPTNLTAPSVMVREATASSPCHYPLL